MSEKGILVYSISNSFNASLLNEAGIDGEGRLYAIKSENLFAVVSDVGLDEYSEEAMAEKSEDIGWLKEKAQIFMNIMLKISGVSCIIPMKFLTIFTSEDRVKGMIGENYEQFTRNFDKIDGRSEVSVKIYCDGKLYKENIMGEEIKAFEKTLAGKPKGAAFFLKKKFEGELDDKLQNRICRKANDFSNELKMYAEDMKSNKILAKEITGVETPMVLNCAFLVDAKQKETLAAAVRKISDENVGSGFSLEFSGPWPPYSFCE